MLKPSLQTEKRKKLFLLHFKQVRVSFASSIKGITDETTRHNYASLVLDRFLVLFFLQHQGLLDNNIRYLQDHLNMMHTVQADTFFAVFFLPLCHTILNGRTRSDECYPSFGHVPMLAHPLFQKHPLEDSYQPEITDETLYKLFYFCEKYRWELSLVGAAPCACLAPCACPDLCICPVVHHDIFADLLEQRSNQKQTGTYYTTEDVTGYIAKNTIIPVLFHRLQKRCPAIVDQCSTIWQCLMHTPERYISVALQQPAYLPRETMPEYQHRQQCFANLIALLQQGTVRTINAMVTYNLDILRFLVDIISTHQDLGLLITLFTELEQLTVLDPTCGSGAFLCAALATLQMLYMACLQRMQVLVGKYGQAGSVGTMPCAYPASTIISAEATFARASAILTQMADAPSLSYFVVHHIIVYNLYGVDLLDEATRVCTLRLYLTLLAQTQRIEDVPAFYQIPMHIKTGNALVGDVYSTAFPEVARWGGFAVILGNPPYIEYSKVRKQYAINGYEEKSCGNVYAAMLERSLALLHPDGSYIGLLLPMSICGSQRFAQLRALLTKSLSPIWLANFDIFPCRLFGNAFQRFSLLLAQLSPKAEAVEIVPGPFYHSKICTTRIHRWYPEERPFLINLLRYTPCCQPTTHTSLTRLPVFPKLASTLHAEILQKIMAKSNGHTIAMALQSCKTPFFVYYQEATNYWIKAVCHIPFYKRNGITMTSPHSRLLFFGDEETARIIMALLNSSLFYLWFTTYSDGFHLAHSLVTAFPCSQELLARGKGDDNALIHIAIKLEADLLAHTRLSTRNKRISPLSTMGESEPQDRHAIELTEYQVSFSKGIIDEIDRYLAHSYDLTKEELDFIITYDQKYRARQAKDRSRI